MTWHVQPLVYDRYRFDEYFPYKSFVESGPPHHGMVCHLSQGTYEEEVDWITHVRPQWADNARCGDDFYEGFYHYLDLTIDGSRQAQWFLTQMQRIGGHRQGVTLPAMVDVERGGQRVTAFSKKLLVDRTLEFATEYERQTGMKPIRYGGELLRAYGHPTVQECGCSAGSIALYGPNVAQQVVTDTGIDPAHWLWWQYDGDGEAYLKGYERGYTDTDGKFYKSDISATVHPLELQALKNLANLGRLTA